MRALPDHANTKFQRYWRGLDKEERQTFADAIGLSMANINCNLIRPIIRALPGFYPTRGSPRIRMMKLIADSTNGICSYRDIWKHFYPDEKFYKDAIKK